MPKRVGLRGLVMHPDPETEDMSVWSSHFEPGTNGGGWIIQEPVSPDRLRRIA